MKNTLRFGLLLSVMAFVAPLRAQWSGTNPEYTSSKVGIDASTPTTSLHIGQNGATSIATYQGGGAAGATTWEGLLFDAYINNADNFRRYADIVSMGYGNGGAGGGVLRFLTKAITNGTPGVERMRIQETGNVGIGTSSPGTKLEVTGDIRTTTSGQSIGARYASGSDNYLTSLIWNSNNPVLTLGNNGINQIRAGKTATGGYLNFIVNNTAAETAATDGITAMTLEASGDVGIGTTSPVARLDVEHNGSSQYGVYVLNNANAQAVGTTAQGIQVAGWGSTAGGSGYGVYATGNAYGAYTAYGVNATGNAAAGGTAYGIYASASGGTTNWAGYFSGNVYASGSMTIGTYGGITSVPTTYGSIGLSITKGGYYGVLMGQGTANANLMYDTSGNGGIYYESAGTWAQYYIKSTNHLNINTSTDLGATLGVNGSGYFSGNVGVGTTGPRALLDVRSSTTTLSGGDVPGRAVITSQNETVYQGTLSLESDSAMDANKGGSLVFKGIYTGVAPAAYAAITGYKENATNGNYAGYLALYTRTNGSTNGERMRIDSTGNVGIGTTSPGMKLDVTGNFRATGQFTGSSRKLKKDIEKLEDEDYQKILESVIGLHLVSYRYNNQDDKERKTVGIIAEDAPKELLDSREDSLNNTTYMSYALAAIKAQQKVIEKQKELTEELSRRIARLEKGLR